MKSVLVSGKGEWEQTMENLEPTSDQGVTNSICKGCGYAYQKNSKACKRCVVDDKGIPSNYMGTKEDRPSLKEEGVKNDDGKLRWDLMPFEPLDALAEVVTYGANKYKPNNWQSLKSDRLFAAGMRHLSKYKQGEIIDAESGLPHLNMAFCNLYFLVYQSFTRKGRDAGTKEFDDRVMRQMAGSWD